ncbi:uncharacterized protein [Eurosta solidaginis]|uniref:uncharacterized protein n=1 Tax=Eurosta solidaginis TaxID=178769 RepID=UPI003530884F
MSFFRNFRTKTRSKSSARDTTPVNTNSRPGSVLSNVTTHTTGSASARRESIDSRTDSLLNRSDTFILDSDQEDKESKHNSSNNSTLEKKSKKSKVFSKFATFTKRIKTPTPEKAVAAVNPSLEHHPSDNATNTYYKWKADNQSSAHTLEYDAQTDPFHFLYEQQSSLKDMQKGGNSSNNGSIHSTHSSAHSSTNGQASQYNQIRESNQPFDSSTFRKGKMTAQLKEQLSQLKEQTKADLHEAEAEAEEEPESVADKYKTVTLNSFRKSFREKFLQNQNNPAHNPAWFVEVEPPKVETHARSESKENRSDFLIFDNENYRPTSRSPVRHNSKERATRATSRSPVKRNETFRMERPTIDKTTTRKQSAERQKNAQRTEAVPSIRIEIKNSITPNMPGRIVPVGVAKPIPAQDSYQRVSARSVGGGVLTSATSNKSPKINSERGDKSPLHNWAKPITVTPVRYPSAIKANNAPVTNGRYQTLVQIHNEANAKPATPTQSSTFNHHSTRIQLGAAGGSPTLQKRLNTPGTRHSLATPLQMNALRSYELFKGTPLVTTKSATERKLQHPKHTYFGDASINNGGATKSISTTTFSMDRMPVHSTDVCNGTTTTTTSKSVRSYPTSASRLQQPQVVRVSGGNTPSYEHRSQQNYQQQPQQQQSLQRVVVPMQRSSRSPIKMPWR